MTRDHGCSMVNLWKIFVREEADYSVGSLRRTCTHRSLPNTYTQAKGSGSAYLLGVLNKEMENLCNDLCVG